MVQEAGEMVITMPGAFHEGFNAGNNIAVAVNVASRYWVTQGAVSTTCDCPEKLGNAQPVNIPMNIFLHMYSPMVTELDDYVSPVVMEEVKDKGRPSTVGV